MNRFRIKPQRADDFIEIWKSRESHLDSVPGFREFHLLRGESDGEAITFVSHSVWDSGDDFTNWTHSEQFRAAHASAGGSRDIYLGPPQFEGYRVVL